MITEKHGRTTVYKCGKRFEEKEFAKSLDRINKSEKENTLDEITPYINSDKPESKPDKKKYKNSREG